MNLKKRLLRNCRLYLVLDKVTAGQKNLTTIAKSAILGGVDILQLRWKNGSAKEILRTGRELRKITERYKVLFIVDDRIDFALILDADGVHLGQGDLPIKEARSLLGKEKIIGFSTHSYPQAKKAVLEGADYISIGPIFKTSIKPDYKPIGLRILKKLKGTSLNIPIFTIGGINSHNVRRVTKNGTGRIAVVRAIVRARDPKKSAQLLKGEVSNI